MTRQDIAQILGTTEKNLNARLIGLKIAPVCGRCGGCGRYSFNGQHSICYGCGGKGHVAPSDRDLPAIYADACEAAQDGRLSAYLEFLAARRATKNATDRVMSAWKGTGIGAAYDWRKSYGPYANPRDRDIAEINAKMAHAFGRVLTAASGLDPHAASYRADTIALARMVDEALDLIARAELEFQAVR